MPTHCPDRSELHYTTQPVRAMGRIARRRPAAGWRAEVQAQVLPFAIDHPGWTGTKPPLAIPEEPVRAVPARHAPTGLAAFHRRAFGIDASYVRSHTDTATRNPQHHDTGAAIGASLAAARSAGTRGEKDRRAPFTDASAHAELSTDSLIEEMRHSAEEPQ